jgi:Domain of unknown function (DUF222)
MSGPSFHGAGADDDWDQDAEMAAYLADIEAGQLAEPGPWESPGCTVSLGEAADVDLADLEDLSFAEGNPGDGLAPGPVLAALTERAAEDMSSLSDDALLGTVSAARRLAARAEYLEHRAVAEFGRRRAAQREAAKAAGARPGRRAGEFPGEELAFHQVSSDNAAYEKLAFAADLDTRLPHTFAGLGAGRLDRYRALIIHRATLSLSDAHAAEADQILAAAAPGLTYQDLRAKAAAVEMQLDPEGVKRREEEARARHRRVEARREDSGNMAYSGRELSPEEALAAKAAIDADAAALRNAGAEGSLRELRVRAYLARLQGSNPLDGLTAGPGSQHDSGRAGPDDPAADSGPGGRGPRPGAPVHPGPEDADQGRLGGDLEDTDTDAEADEDEGRPGGFGGGPKGPGTPAGGLAPLPALTTLVVPAGTLFGWSNAPADAGTWGLTGPDDTRRLVQAASQHPRSRWCVTVTDARGYAIGHGCARGPHPWTPAPGPGSGSGPGGRDSPGEPHDHDRPPGPDARQAAQLLDLLRRLNVTLHPIAKGGCDHRHQEDRYVPSRKLKHLVRARTATCTAPGCGARAIHCDLDHTLAYPAGITCECDLAPKCRHHHRVKQAPGWRLDQPAPGVRRWTTPAGRHYTTTPTVYGT